MKKLLVVLIIITFFSCHSTKYTHSGNVSARLNFTKGKWLLNTIDAPRGIRYDLEEQATEKFTEIFGNRFSVVNTTAGILVPSNIANNPSKAILTDIKNTGYDFLISIRAKKIADEVQALELGGRDTTAENIGEVTVDIYDLNLLEKFYSHSVTGKVFATKNNQDVVFAKTTKMIITGAFERIVKKMKKNQIKTK